MVALLRGHHAVDRPARGLQVHHRDHRLEQRRRDPTAFARAHALVQGGEDADGEIQARREIRHRNADPGRRRARHAGHAHEPAHALCDLVDAAALRVRAVLAEARDRAVDEPRVARVHGLVVEAEPVLHLRAHVLDQHVRAVDEPQQERPALFLLQVAATARACCGAGSGSPSRGRARARSRADRRRAAARSGSRRRPSLRAGARRWGRRARPSGRSPGCRRAGASRRDRIRSRLSQA